MVKVLLKFNAAVIKEYPFEKNELTVGRKEDNDIVIDNPAVSGHHARIVKQGGEFILEDLNSTNGTFLKDRKVIKASLHHKDEVGVAKHLLVFINEDEAAAAPAPKAPPVSSDATIVMTPATLAQTVAANNSEKKNDGVGELRVVSGETNGFEFPLTGLTTYIGKSEQATVKLKGFFAPDLAACVARKPDGYYLKIIEEKSVKLNGVKLTEQAQLQQGDIIEVGALRLRFVSDAAEEKKAS